MLEGLKVLAVAGTEAGEGDTSRARERELFHLDGWRSACKNPVGAVAINAVVDGLDVNVVDNTAVFAMGERRWWTKRRHLD